jgi:hypothetical protein
MRTSMAYFAGAGTVVVAIAAGLGGGLLIANMVNRHSPRQEMTKLEQRMSSKPMPVSNAPSEPVQYLAETQAAAANPGAAAAPTPNQPETPPAEASTASNTGANAQPPASAPQPPAPVKQAATPEQTKAPEDVFAKAADADVRRETRRAEERRRAERRQQWAEKRRYQQRQDQELREVEQKVRDDTGPTRIFATEPVRIETPRIKLFGEDD